MSDDDEKTLGKLVRFSRYARTERRLCCPECGVAGILLVVGKLHCVWCEWVGERLTELVVKP